MSRPSSSKENTMDIVRGSLDEITRPASTKKRPGSRGTLGKSSSLSRIVVDSQQSMSLEILPPAEDTDRELDLQVVEYASSGSEWSEEEDGTQYNDTSARQSSSETKEARQRFNSSNKGRPDLISSEEETDIVSNIRKQITDKVRGEMEEELLQYQRPAQEDVPGREEEEEDLAEMEPKLREAILKMRKYDRILKKKVKREKEVKRDRIMLQKRLREELDNIHNETEGKKEYKDVTVNEEKFLALTLPASHSEGLEFDYPEVTPVFPTQVILDDEPETKTGNEDGRSGSASQTSQNRDAQGGGKQKKKGKKQQDDLQHDTKSSDFIRRNIELAGAAGDVVAMTDDEKKRLEDLLCDIDEDPELEEEVPTDNPFQICLHPGDGFLPTDADMKSLADIDSRLKALLPPDDFQSIASTPRNFMPEQATLFTRTNLNQFEDADFDQLGEKALKETREQREYKARLRDIENELARLSTAVEIEIESPVLTEGQLQDLLDQCSRTLSRATEEKESLQNSPRSPTSSRLSIFENPPRLADDVLQQLLREARSSMSGYDDGNIQGSKNEDDGTVAESISEETIRELLRDSRTTSRASSSSRLEPDNEAELIVMSNGNHNLLESRGHYQSYENGEPGPGSTQLNNKPHLNNEKRSILHPGSGNLPSNEFVRNTLSVDSAEDTDYSEGVEDNSSKEYSSAVPHPPPSSGRRTQSRSRNYSPLPKKKH